MGVGELAVRFARSCVDAETSGKTVGIPDGPCFSEMRGVFVTIDEFPSGDLRGCIGYPYPVMSLGEALRESAASACHDPRFPDLRASETDAVVVEVTILTVPRELPYGAPEDLPGLVSIGRDGLMIECMGRRGLLLPQVPVEYGWDEEEFLSHLSVKAGLPPDAWTYPGARIWSFEGEIYSEDSPRGSVSKRDI